jgi:hypothetical protein
LTTDRLALGRESNRPASKIGALLVGDDHPLLDRGLEPEEERILRRSRARGKTGSPFSIGSAPRAAPPRESLDPFRSHPRAASVPFDLMHRVTSVATGGLGALPHTGAVISLLAICGLTHHHADLDLFVVAVARPLLALGVLLVLGATVGAF